MRKWIEDPTQGVANLTKYRIRDLARTKKRHEKIRSENLESIETGAMGESARNDSRPPEDVGDDYGELLVRATVAECQRWHQETFGYPFDEARARQIKAEIDLARRENAIEEKSLAALKSFCAALHEMDAAVAPLRGGRIALPKLSPDDPPNEVSADEIDADGGLLTRWAQDVVNQVRLHPTIHSLLGVAPSDLDQLRVGAEGHKGAPLKDAEHRLAWFVLAWNKRTPVPPSVLAKVWILLGNCPKRPGKNDRTPADVIKSVADNLKKILPIVEEAQKNSAAARKKLDRVRRGLSITPTA
ncbi:MAG: hypothetical protein JWN04_3852 [Myxococcaceae bacterium]|nr:hypothetical protein [Myxococcaceae bacterium]